MPKKYEEKFFIPQPVSTGTTVEHKFDDETSTLPVYKSGDELLKWSADFPIPAIGSRIFITMNGIGWAVVKGYFSADGWLGLMTLATNPPKWLKQQHRRDTKAHYRGEHNLPQWMLDGIGCEFGTEIALKRPKKPKLAPPSGEIIAMPATVAAHYRET